MIEKVKDAVEPAKDKVE